MYQTRLAVSAWTEPQLSPACICLVCKLLLFIFSYSLEVLLDENILARAGGWLGGVTMILRQRQPCLASSKGGTGLSLANLVFLF